MSHPTAPLFIGLDNSTQALKAVVVDQHFQNLYEYRLDFSEDLPEYGTKSGVIIGDEGEVRAPVIMYVEALERVFDKLKEMGLDFSRVKSISGSSAQHSIVLLSPSYTTTTSHPLSATTPLKTHLADAFSSPWATNWQDSTTTSQCRAMEEAVHAASETTEKGESPGHSMANITGSSAHERFSGPQLKKIFERQREEVWDKTERVCLLSSFLTGLLCLDGEVKGMDEADAAGMNLYSLPHRSWSPSLLSSITNNDPIETARLEKMLGQVEREKKSAGRVGGWFRGRYGFGEDCEVVYFTGDNPATLLSFALSPGDAIISLGTSDTVLLATETYNPHPNYHIFPHPAGDTLVGQKRYMAMLCYKNGSLAREMVRDGIAGASKTKSWDQFNSAVKDTPAPSTSSNASTNGNQQGSTFGFYYRDLEIIPRNVQGLFRLSPGGEIQSEKLKLGSLDSVHWRPSDARKILESQFLSFKSRINQLLPADSPRLGKVYVTGGASANPTITALLSSVINAPVYTGSDGSAQGCAMGGAYKAAWAYECMSGGRDVDFGEFVKQRRGEKGSRGGAGGAAEGRLIAKPDEGLVEVYDALLEDWREAERRVVELCKK